MGAAEHAPRDPFRVLERRHGLAAIVERPEEKILAVQGNLAGTYHQLGRVEEANRMLRDVYSGSLKLYGEEHEETLRAANNYSTSLNKLQRFKEAKPLFRKTMPVARRVLGENDYRTLTMRGNYARALYKDPDATLDDLHEAVTTLEDSERIARRVLGGSHPRTTGTERQLRYARVVLRARAAARIGRTFRTIWRRREKLATVDE